MADDNHAATHEATASRLTRAEWGLLLVLAAVQFTHLLDFVIMMPLGPEFATTLHTSPREFGWLVSSYGFAASLSGLLAAGFIDRYDRKGALLLLYAGFTAGTLLCAAAPNYLLLVAARAVAGGFAGVMAAQVLAVVGDVFPDSRRGRAMGVVMSAFSVASVIGVPAGLVLSNHLGWRTPFAALGVLSVAVWIMAWQLLPPLRGHLTRGAAHRPASFWTVLTHATHLRAYALTTTLVLGSFSVIPFLSIYLVNNVGRVKEELPYIWLCGGAATLVTMTPVGWLSDRFGKLLVFRVVALLTIGPTLWLTNLSAGPLAVTLLATTAYTVLASARMVPAMALLTACAAPRNRGSFLSVNASVQQLAAALAPLLGGWLLGDTEGARPLVGFSSVGLVAASAMFGSLVLAGWLRPAPGPQAPDEGAAGVSRPVRPGERPALADR